MLIIRMAGVLPDITIGICAYNEEKNLPLLLRQLGSCGFRRILEIIVVSSGSTDDTESIVRGFMKKDKRVKLVSEKDRRGKASAVNLALDNARGDIIILCGADLSLEKNSIERLAAAFSNPEVGMAGGRPIPIDDRMTMMGFCAHLLWGIHHRIALINPKCGEIVAVRAAGYRIPQGMGADEAYLEHMFRKDGWKIVYCPEAVVHNKGPGSIGDFIRQRRRIHAQHLYLENKTGYRVATANPAMILRGFLTDMDMSPKTIIFALAAVSLELASSALGAYDFYIAGETHQAWAVSETTKVMHA
jgi:poly-beta-1,6-N-acetyl-D-glucosamine synthase